MDRRSRQLHAQGERLIEWMTGLYEGRVEGTAVPAPTPSRRPEPLRRPGLVPYSGPESLQDPRFAAAQPEPLDVADLFGIAPGAMPYDEFKRRMADMKAEGG